MPIDLAVVPKINLSANRGTASLAQVLTRIPADVYSAILAGEDNADRAEAARDAALTAAGVWTASTSYAAGAVAQAPDGSRIKRNTSGTSRATFDATEQAAWTAVSTKAGTLEQAALAASYAPLPAVTRNPLTGWFHVDGFAGVDKTGATESTTAVANALAAISTAGGGRAYFTSGTYLLDAGTLTVGSDTTIEFAHTATVKLKNSATTNTAVFMVTGNRVRITGGTIDGNRTNNTTSNIRGVQIAPGCIDVEVDHVKFLNLRGSAVKGKTNSSGAACENIRVHHNTATNCGVLDHAIFDFAYTTLRSSISHNTVLAGAAQCHAVEVANGSDDCVVEGNIIDQPGWMGVEVYNSNGVSVVGNAITRTGAAAISLAYADRGLVTANKIYDVGFESTNNSGQAIELAGCRWVTVTGNDIDYVHGGSSGLSVGIAAWASNAPSVRPSDYCTITGNEISNCADAAGVRVASGGHANVITGNTVNECLHGIYDFGNTYTTVSGNSIYSTLVGSGVYLDSCFSPLVVGNNVHSGGAALVKNGVSKPVIRNNQGITDNVATNGQAGVLAPTALGWTVGTVTAASGHCRPSRFVPQRNMTITKIAFNVTTAAASNDACDIGIYDASGNRLVSTGATTGLLNSTGVKTVTVTSTDLEAGVTYYAAISFGTPGGSAAQIQAGAFFNAKATQLFGTTTGVIEADLVTSAHPLPATFSLTGASSIAPTLALRES